MKANYLAGLYRMTKWNGEEVYVYLKKGEAKVLFKIHDKLGFIEIEYVGGNKYE